MKRILLPLLMCAVFIACNNSRSKDPGRALTGDISQDLKMLVPPGHHSVSILGGIKQTQRQKELMDKLIENTKKNQEWFAKYTQTVPVGEAMPYHENFGLTREEYAELMEHVNNPEMVSTGIETLTVELANDTISFWGNDALKDCNSLQIDLKSNTGWLREYKMAFSGSTSVSDNKNGLGSKWKGYSWKYEIPDSLTPEKLSDFSGLTIKQYTLTIGQMEKNGKTFLQLKGREIEDGVRTVEFHLPLVFL